MQEIVTSNRRRAAALVGVHLAVLIGFGGAVDVLAGAGGVVVAGAAVLALAWVAAAWWKADKVALRSAGARPADPTAYRRYHNIVDGLVIAAGLPKPALHVVDDPAPNAFAIGRNPDRAALVVTTGLLDRLNRIELEGVLAHELSHVKDRDTLVTTLAVVLVGIPGLVAAPVVAPLLRLGVTKRREALADFGAVRLTRYPPGLIQALEKLRADDSVVHSASRATAHLWIEAPLGGRGAWLDRAFDTHPPLDDRIEALKEL